MSAQETRQEDVRWSGLFLEWKDVRRGEDCARLRVETEGEVLRLGTEHAKHCHSMKMLPPDMTTQVKAAIKTVNV